MRPAQKDYRADIDGLRAFAIVPVVLYHAGVASLSGGFVGVDVFFVISGYLIGKHILAELEAGDFSIARFYERRVRRLMPAFLAASMLATAAAWFVLFPDQLREFATSLIWSAFFVGNIHFWLAADYFGPAAETMPLLHYWSLGVEEQFYLVLPWLMIVLFKRGLGILVAGLLVMLSASLVSSQLMLSIQPEGAFFLLPFRGWEMLAGSLLAVRGFPSPRSPVVGGMAVAAGCTLILWAVFTFSRELTFPGLAAMPPVVGTLLTLWGGQICNSASTAMGSGPLVYLGRISYSLYLVHWPTIVFANQLYPEASSAAIIAGTVVVSLVLAVAIYHFVETPTRNRHGSWTAWRLSALALGGVSGTAVAGILILAGSGWPSRYPEAVQKVLAYRYDRKADYRDHVCLLDARQSFVDLQGECLPDTDKMVALWGDSLAAHLVVGIRPLVEAAGYKLAQATASACPPLLGVEKATRPHCRQFNDDVYDWLLAHKPRFVLISGTWAGTTAETSQLRAQIADLNKLGTKVIVFGPGPRFIGRVPTLIADRMVRDQAVEAAANMQKRMLRIDRNMEHAVASTGAVYVSVLEASCPANICSLTDADGTPLYWDNYHLTDVGSKAVASLIQDQLLTALGRD